MNQSSLLCSVCPLDVKLFTDVDVDYDKLKSAVVHTDGKQFPIKDFIEENGVHVMREGDNVTISCDDGELSRPLH